MPRVTSKVLTISQLARVAGLSAHTIRYYESAGILRPSNRAPNGHRRYGAEDVLWLEFIMKLKVTGMPLSGIKAYAALRAEGEMTLNPRLAMLELHRERLVAKLHELQQCADALDAKIRIYREMLLGAEVHNPRANDGNLETSSDT